MINKYYIDTCIWIDFYEDRKDGSSDLGKFAYRIFVKIIASRFIIVLSELSLSELSRFYSEDEINGLFYPFKGMVEIIKVEKPAKMAAIQLSYDRNVPYADALHAILAKQGNAILLTRDNHFMKLKDVCTIRRPEELI